MAALRPPLTSLAGPSSRPPAPAWAGRLGQCLPAPRGARQFRRRGGGAPATPDGDTNAPPPAAPEPTARRRRPRRALDPVEQATFAEWARGTSPSSSSSSQPPPPSGGWARGPPSPTAALDGGAYDAPGSPEATLQNVLAVSLALLLGAALTGMAVRIVAVAAALTAAALRYSVVAILLLFFALFLTP